MTSTVSLACTSQLALTACKCSDVLNNLSQLLEIQRGLCPGVPAPSILSTHTGAHNVQVLFNDSWNVPKHQKIVWSPWNSSLWKTARMHDNPCKVLSRLSPTMTHVVKTAYWKTKASIYFAAGGAAAALLFALALLLALGKCFRQCRDTPLYFSLTTRIAVVAWFNCSPSALPATAAFQRANIY